MHTIKQLHPFNFAILALISLTGVFLCHTISGYLMICSWSILILWLTQDSLKWKSMLIFMLTLVPAVTSFYISNRLFSTSINSYDGIDHGINLSVRLFSLALISYIYIIHMPREDFILNLLQRKLISVNIGFAMLAVFNSFAYLGDEFNKIQLAYQMRFGKRIYSPKIFIPLLVAAARYAHTLSISMYARGINNQRTYYTVAKEYRIQDTMIVILTIATIIGSKFI